ncbi:hypothetical protein RclHR1_02070001 [Rhizophagus clarus]|nr:hypothetical protein RclHR1_02070001 [Rhizophagus clarus]
MNGGSSQSEYTSGNIVADSDNLEISNSIFYKTGLHVRATSNITLLKLEEDGLVTSDEKAKELIKDLTEIKCLNALKLLFENSQNEFSPQILRDSLVALADPTPFDYYAKQSVARLELHLRTWVLVLEKICFTQMRLSKELRDKIYNSLPKFAEIHKKTTQVMQEGIENNFKSDFNRFGQQKADKYDEKIAKKRNYNIDFLLTHLRDTLHSLRDDETWLQEFIRRIRDFLKTALNISPGILAASTGVNLPNDCSILSIFNQVRQSLSFKYPVASYYVDWRIMLIIQHNLFTWSECSEKIISKKLGELVLIEYMWGFLEREWINITNRSILDSQSKFDEVSNKVIKAFKSTGSLLSDLAGNEPLALPHTLWFGLLDIAQNLIQKSTRKATYGLCYYLAIESLNKAPSSFIQFKAIEILFYLHNIDNQMFSIIENDFDQYTQMLKNNLIDSSEKFQNLLTFVKEKYFEDLKVLNDDIGTEKKGKGKGKCLNQDSYIIRSPTSESIILDVIADEMTCPINSEPMDQLCILKCQHALSLNSLKMLKQKTCPKCRKKIEDNDIRYLSQICIYKYLYSKFSESGHILPTIELESSDQNQYDSDDSDNSEIDFIITKKKFMNSFIKLNSNISSIITRFTKKQHPTYQNILKELYEGRYESAENLCKELLNFFPKSYSLKCILAYIYRCLSNYKQAHLYLNEAINLKPKKPIAYFICGEIFFWQENYNEAINYLDTSLRYKVKVDNKYIIFANSYLFNNNIKYNDNALEDYKTALKNDPSNYLCLKNCAYIYERKKDYQNALVFLDKLLSINRKDSLILCYYGEILCYIKQYNNAILYFTKANNIDPENIHNLNKRAIAYYILQEYDEVLSDIEKVIKLNPLNNLAYYLKCLTYYTKGDINNATVAFKKCTQLLLNLDDNNLANTQLLHLEYLLNKDKSTELINILAKINQIPNIKNSETLLFIRCSIYIELNMYHEAELDLYMLYESTSYHNDNYISYIHLLRKYLTFWPYLNKDYYINYSDFGINDKFNKYLYHENNVYLISNLINYNEVYSQFQESDPNSLSGQILCSKNEGLYLKFPALNSFGKSIIWKINVKKIISKDCFIRISEKHNEHILRYKDMLEFEGLGWIEYRIPINLWNSRFSIEISGSIDMKIDYIRFGNNEDEIAYIPDMGYMLPGYHEFCPSIPEAFKDKYFSKKEMKNLLELQDILSNL